MGVYVFFKVLAWALSAMTWTIFSQKRGVLGNNSHRFNNRNKTNTCAIVFQKRPHPQCYLCWLARSTRNSKGTKSLALFFSEYFTSSLGFFIFKMWVPFEFIDGSYVSRQIVQLVTNCPNLHAQHIKTKVHFDNNVYMYFSSWKSMFLVTFNPIMMIL